MKIIKILPKIIWNNIYIYYQLQYRWCPFLHSYKIAFKFNMGDKNTQNIIGASKNLSKDIGKSKNLKSIYD